MNTEFAILQLEDIIDDIENEIDYISKNIDIPIIIPPYLTNRKIALQMAIESLIKNNKEMKIINRLLRRE